MSYHPDTEVNAATIRLLDALCQYERDSGNGSILIVAHSDPQFIVLAQDGKPIDYAEFYLGYLMGEIKTKMGIAE